MPCLSFPTKPQLTLDEFFDFTKFTSVRLSPMGEHLLIETIRPSWNTSSYGITLWIYDIQQQNRKLNTRNPHQIIKPQWSPNGHWIAFLLDETPSNATDHHRSRRSIQDYPQTDQYIYSYSLISNDLLAIQIGKDIPLSFTWSNTDFSLYLATSNLQSAIEDDNLNREEWKDAIQYRQNKLYEQSRIFRVDINQNNPPLTLGRIIVKKFSFLIGELLFVPFEEKLLMTSVSPVIEDLQDFEICSIDLWNVSSSSPLVRLTDNEVIEHDLQLSVDGIHILYQTRSLGSSRRKFNNTQVRLCSLNLIDGHS